MLDQTTVEKFKASLGGELIQPNDDGYDEARKVWNAMVDKRPALIARCKGTADVITAVNFARETNLLLSIRGGGHNIAGTALCDDGLTIDLSGMKGLHVDLRTRRVRAQPGCNLGDLDRETQIFGLAVPAGIVTDTGIAGLTLGGGFGWLTRRYGYTSDNLLSADVVTADGTFLRANETENADLFWGLRGGGGNFGVVTSFEYQAYPVGPQVTAGMIIHPIENAREVVDFFREFSANAPEELCCLLTLRLAPPAPFLPKEVHGKPIVGIAVCHSGNLEDGERVIRPLKEFGDPLADVIAPKPFAVHQTLFDVAMAPGRHYYWKSHYLPEFPEAAGNVLMEHAAKITSPHSSILVFQLGGALARFGETDSPAGNRDAAYVLNVAASWEDPAHTEEQIAWSRGCWSDMQQFSTGGVNVNFMTGEEGGKRVLAAFGDANYKRLVEIKNKYDPQNMFRLNQNIPPTV
ncbi:MAG: FAD-binding oxidoreductase [Deltaproteobacteria bacterium]|nr:MAG: FAD-binding oxidoreductase [Deltaproteobacteria bacterium]